MKALLIGFWSGNGTANQMLAHERGVRASLLATAPANTEVDIVLQAANPNADNEPDLKARIDFSASALLEWITNEPTNYDVVCYSYTGLNYTALAPIIEQLGIQLFCAMPNSGDYSRLTGISGSCDGVQFNDDIIRPRSNIFLIGGGGSQNVAGFGSPLTAFTQALDKGTPNTTSWTTGSAAGHYLNYIALGLTTLQARKAFLQSCSFYPNWTAQNGFGAVATAYNVPESYDNFGLCDWAWRRLGCNAVEVFVIPFLGDTVSEYKVYVNGSVAYTGGLDDGFTYYGTTIGRRATINFFESGSYDLQVSAVVGGQELFGVVRSVDITVVDPQPPPPAPPPPEPQPEPEPIFPVILTGTGYIQL